jgi:hypothetical protein
MENKTWIYHFPQLDFYGFSDDFVVRGGPRREHGQETTDGF